MSAWLLPEHIADVLPVEARRIEELRRIQLDRARRFGYELVMPPMLEYLDSLLTGTGQTLDLQTFKLIDQLTGRTMGLRADTTPQVARIDAHLLNRRGVARLCYCGPVLHARPLTPGAGREPLQFGAEIYGHAGLEADLEVLELALECLTAAGLARSGVVLELADVRVVQGLLAMAHEAVGPRNFDDDAVKRALSKKDASALHEACAGLPAAVTQGFMALLKANGDVAVLARAEAELPRHPWIERGLADLRWLSGQLGGAEVSLAFDLGDLSADGYAYYSGMRFACYSAGADKALVRGGRYDEVGAVFGRSRPAVGFSADLRELTEVATFSVDRTAIRAPWAEGISLRTAVSQLRSRGETVVCMLPGHDDEVDEFECDRELVEIDGLWVVKPLD